MWALITVKQENAAHITTESLPTSKQNRWARPRCPHRQNGITVPTSTGIRIRVREWLAAHAGKIEVFYLPSYSPKLNPDELLNADLKQRVTKAAPARTRTALTRTAVGALRSIQKQPHRVESYFNQKDVCYAAA
jgi:transposase